MARMKQTQELKKGTKTTSDQNTNVKGKKASKSKSAMSTVQQKVVRAKVVHEVQDIQVHYYSC